MLPLCCSAYGFAAAAHGVIDMAYVENKNVTGIIQLKRDAVSHFDNRYKSQENRLPYTQNPFNLFPRY